MASIEVGPTSVSIDAGSMTFQQYHTGVINSEDCGTYLNHAVLAVGYGTKGDGQAYYLVKNSWGTGWGEQGYVLIANNGDGKGICGIQDWPMRPII